MKPLVFVEWVDSRQPSTGWKHVVLLEPCAALTCVSVGFIMQKGKDVVLLAQSMADLDDPEQTQVMGLMEIPVNAIVRMRTLKKGGNIRKNH